MRKYANASELAADAGVSPSVLQKTFETYNAAAARGSGDPFGRRFFTNAPIRMDEELHVAIITPVVHCARALWLCRFFASALASLTRIPFADCMGGLEISPRAEVLRASKINGALVDPSPIHGLFAAGEVRAALLVVVA